MTHSFPTRRSSDFLRHHRSHPKGLRRVLRRLRQLDALAAVSLPARPCRVHPAHLDRPPARQRAIRPPPAALPRGIRPRLGPCLPLHAAGRAPAQRRLPPEDRLLPPHSLPTAGGAASSATH